MEFGLISFLELQQCEILVQYFDHLACWFRKVTHGSPQRVYIGDFQVGEIETQVLKCAHVQYFKNQVNHLNWLVFVRLSRVGGLFKFGGHVYICEILSSLVLVDLVSKCFYLHHLPMHYYQNSAKGYFLYTLVLFRFLKLICKVFSKK